MHDYKVASCNHVNMFIARNSNERAVLTYFEQGGLQKHHSSAGETLRVSS